MIPIQTNDPVTTSDEAPRYGNPLSEQIGGSHYKNFKIQPIEFIHANNLDFLSGNIVKYAARHPFKGKAEDVKKIIHYAKLILKLQYGENND